MTNKKSPPLRLAVDFDFVLHDPNNKLSSYKLGQPISGAVESMRHLKESGAILVIHSLWADTEEKCRAIAEWCKYFLIPYDFITNKKPDCDFYIDDKAIRFESWPDTLQQISERHRQS